MQNLEFQAELSGFIDFREDAFEEILEDLELIPEHTATNSQPAPVLPTYEPISSLRSEERNIIQSCTDVNLRNLLNLNRSKRMQLIQMYKHLKDLLLECRENIRSKEHYISKMKKTFSCNTFVNPWKLTAPYFKGKDLFPSPLNSDAISKKNSGELSIYDRGAPTKWTTFECETLVKAVKVNYNMNRQKDKQKKIVKLQTNLRAANSTAEEKEELQAEIDKLSREIECLKANAEGEVPELYDTSFIDWYRVASVFLKGKHSAFECESFWNIYLHPSINKTSWTEQENVKILQLGHKYSFENWERIAAELQTDRTGFLVCVHYSSVLCSKYRSDKFTPDEDKFLVQIVEQYKVAGSIKWSIVAQHFADRSKEQLFHRYTYYLQPIQEKGTINRSKFTEAEDVLLLLLVQKFGKNFVKCAEHVPNRSYMQLKNRYNSNLRCNIQKGTWSTDDDRNILKYVEQNGSKSWGGLTKTMNRSRGQLRQRYMFLAKYLTKYPGSDLSKVPKRKHRNFGNSQNHYNFLKFVAEKFKTLEQIPTVDAIENCLQSEKLLGNRGGYKRPPGRPSKKPKPAPKQKKKNTLKTIDSLLIDFFSNSREIKQVHHQRKLLSIDEAVKDVKHAFNYLGVTLELPDDLSTEQLSLDEIDLKILNQLRKWTPRKSFAVTRFRIPTTINTLVGLRSILIKYQSYKNPKTKGISGFLTGKETSSSTWSASNSLANFNSDTRNQINLEMDTFYVRFKSLFFWPSVFSLVAPPIVVQKIDPPVMELSSESEDESMDVDDDL